MMKLAVIGAIAISTVSAEVITFEGEEYYVNTVDNAYKTCYDHSEGTDRCFIFQPAQRQMRLPATQAPTIVTGACQAYTQVITTGGRRLLQDDDTTRCYTLVNGEKNYVSCSTGTIQTETVTMNTCTDEELIAENSKINESARAFEDWEEEDRSRRLNMALANAGEHCMCDSFCLAMGDCCADFHWWCSPSKNAVSMGLTLTGMDFPWPAIRPEVPTEAPVTSTRCYTLGADGAKNYVACSGTTNVSTGTVSTGTSSSRCYTVGADGVTKNYVPCSGNVSTSTVASTNTNSSSRCYTLGADGVTKNYVPCSN